MPFLFPALASAACDVLILFFSHREYNLHRNMEESVVTAIVGDDSEDDENYFLYRVNYLEPLAVIRLLLLLFPLPYHSYTGTAVRFRMFYKILYGGTIALVLIHMLCLCMFDPDSLATILPFARLFSSSNTSSPNSSSSAGGGEVLLRRILADLKNTIIGGTNDDHGENDENHYYNNNESPLQQRQRTYDEDEVLFFYEEREICWIMLILSLLSVASHLLMFGHVRSTAPDDNEWLASENYKKKKRVLFYYALRKNLQQQQQEQEQELYHVSAIYANGLERTPSNITSRSMVTAHSHLPPPSPTVSMRSLSSQYDDFLLEMQSRFQIAKKEWTKRLDDFTSRLPHANSHLSNPRGSKTSLGSQVVKNPLSLLPLTPFRVLLQLFAYEEVIENGKLDFVFDVDDGEAMTFFVPQLLSFLLHGAYHDCSPKLEEWILDKCTKNIHFAHRCFWFLRAWCLEVPVDAMAPKQPSSTQPDQQPSLSSSTRIISTPPPRDNLVVVVDSAASVGSHHSSTSVPNVASSFASLTPPSPPTPSFQELQKSRVEDDENYSKSKVEDDEKYYSCAEQDELLGKNDIPSNLRQHQQQQEEQHPLQEQRQQQRRQQSLVHNNSSSQLKKNNSSSRLQNINPSSLLHASNSQLQNSVDFLQTSNSNKYLPEERAVIEDLILRVIQCGEEPARVLEFGSNAVVAAAAATTAFAAAGAGAGASAFSARQRQQQHQQNPWSAQEQGPLHHANGTNDYNGYSNGSHGNGYSNGGYNNGYSYADNGHHHGAIVDSDYYENNSVASLTQELVDQLPIDPESGFPSTRHLESAIANKKYGFLPLHNDNHHTLLEDMAGLGGLQDIDGSGNTHDWFLQTPRFLDALISLADGLFLVPREERAADFHRKLQTLEVEFLPSNSVYVPIVNNHHRVWRILSDESIALSTKERVPCIVCLEVVNYSVKSNGKVRQRGFAGRSGVGVANPYNNNDNNLSSNNNNSSSNNNITLSLEIPSFPAPQQQHVQEQQQRQTMHTKLSPKLQQSPSHDNDNIMQYPESDDSEPPSGPSLNFLLPHQMGASESEILNNWRFGGRDPHRRDKFIDKVTSSVIDSISKMHIDQVGNTMRDGLNKIRDDFRDRRRLKDILCLNPAVDGRHDDDDDDDDEMFLTPDEFDNSVSSNHSSDASGVALTPDARRQQHGVVANGCFTKGGSDKKESGKTRDEYPTPQQQPLPSLAPTKLDGSHDYSRQASSMSSSMGQWYSPVPEKQFRSKEGFGGARRRKMERKMERGGDDASCSSSSDFGDWNNIQDKSTDYGSNHERQAQKPLTAVHELDALVSENNIIDPTTTTTATTTPPQTPSPTTPKPPKPVVFRENWQDKEERYRKKSAYGSHPGWRLLPILIKANDDLRQEQLASQIIYRMAYILARERVRVWLCPYEIIAITDRGGIIEAIPDTISLDSLKRNHPNFTRLSDFFLSFFGPEGSDALSNAKANFIESLAAYSIVCYLLQIKDRHNGNILLDNQGHIIHIDFGFFFLSSPGKNTGFESAPFKLTRDFVSVMVKHSDDNNTPDSSHMFRTFRELCCKTFITLRKHCMEIILLVEMLKQGNEDLPCFVGRPDDAIRGLRERFRLDLSDRACKDYVNSLIDESLENWRTNWYDRYQRYCVGVL